LETQERALNKAPGVVRLCFAAQVFMPGFRWDQPAEIVHFGFAGGHGVSNPKFEYRNSKQILNSNAPISKTSFQD
jgi:hypothetical protein